MVKDGRINTRGCDNQSESYRSSRLSRMLSCVRNLANCLSPKFILCIINGIKYHCYVYAMTCEKQQTKKYKLRNSPPYSAMDCKGKTMKGKDGTYVSKPDKNNRYKWVKQSSTTNSTKKNLEGVKPKHKYEIVDNGIIPYVVNDYGKRVEVYSNKYDETTNKAAIHGKILDVPYKKIFVGDNELNLKDYEKRGDAGIQFYCKIRTANIPILETEYVNFRQKPEMSSKSITRQSETMMCRILMPSVKNSHTYWWMKSCM